MARTSPTADHTTREWAIRPSRVLPWVLWAIPAVAFAVVLTAMILVRLTATPAQAAPATTDYGFGCTGTVGVYTTEDSISAGNVTLNPADPACRPGQPTPPANDGPTYHHDCNATTGVYTSDDTGALAVLDNDPSCPAAPHS